ncbi:MAG: hypothetical protein RRZ24_06330 [Clostridia bacterium]
MKRYGKRIINLCLAAFLLFTMTVPRLWLTRICADMTEQAQLASAAIRTGGDHTPYLRELEHIYEKTAPIMRLFLDHVAVDETGAAIGVCVPNTEIAALLSALNAVNAAITHLNNMEAFRWDSIF